MDAEVVPPHVVPADLPEVDPAGAGALESIGVGH